MPRKSYKALFLFFCLSFLIFSARQSVYANNLTIANVTTGNQDITNDTLEIKFDISWGPSWRDSTNYDAAWVFIKFSSDGGNSWRHCQLAPTGYSIGSAGSGDTTNNAVEIIFPQDPTGYYGAFIQRSNNSTAGKFSRAGVTLNWNYSIASISDQNAPLVTIKVFAIEMVYIPTGSFYLGDGDGSTSSAGSFYRTTQNTKVLIDNTLKNSIKAMAKSGTEYDDNQLLVDGIGIKGDAGLDTNNDGTIENTTFPTGYKAFYLMKYEITQGQYRDFLNMLTRGQQNGLTNCSLGGIDPTVVYTEYSSLWTQPYPPDAAAKRNAFFNKCSKFALSNYYDPNPGPSGPPKSIPINRNGIRLQPYDFGTGNQPDQTPTGPFNLYCDLSGNAVFDESSDGEWLACNFLNWQEVAAYACWAGLRPMTELEFEKVCRGSFTPQAGEYAWGSKNSNSLSGYPLTSAGTNSEKVSGSSSQEGPINCCNSSFSGPLRAGFAALDNTSREYSGAGYYGNMELSGNVSEAVISVGSSSQRAFTGKHGNGSLDNNGQPPFTLGWPISGGWRGGSWSENLSLAQTSDRSKAAMADSAAQSYTGGRCARTAP